MAKIQTFWDSLPKATKVGGYMFVAVVLEQFTATLSPELLKMIPELYRVIVYNFIVVLVVETVKRLKELKK